MKSHSEKVQYHQAVRDYLVARRRIALRELRASRKLLRKSAHVYLWAWYGRMKARRQAARELRTARRFAFVQGDGFTLEALRSVYHWVRLEAHYAERIVESGVSMTEAACQTIRSVRAIARTTTAIASHAACADWFAVRALITR